MSSEERIAGFLLEETSHFPEVFERTAPAEDSLDGREYPAAKIGHVRADYDGRRWHGQYFPCRNELRTEPFNVESQKIYGGLVTKFKNLDLLYAFCLKHPGARIGPYEYVFYISGEAADYQVRLINREKDYNLYLHGFAKTRKEGDWHDLNF